jgi:peptidyl-prolyl cis-trans isomerase B (cyclophilin B)
MLKSFSRKLFSRLLLPLLLAVSLGIAACDSLTTNSAATSTSSPPPLGDTTSVPGAQSPTQTAQLPRLNGDAVVTIKIKGKPGPITVKVNGAAAPITAGNFIDLVNRKVYNGTRFHRVVRQPEPFVVQGGDPQSTDVNAPLESLGTGSFIDPKTSQARYIPLEITPVGQNQPVYSQTLKASGVTAAPKLKHTRGAVAMARSQMPDSASAQFYFALAELTFLDGDYAVFGYVTAGMETVDQIQAGDTIESAEVTDGLGNLKVS